MMASYTLMDVTDVFPVGTSVEAYAAANWRTAGLPPAGAPQGSATATATVDAGGEVAFTGLTAGEGYYAAAQMGGTWRYMGFTAPDDTTPMGLDARVDAAEASLQAVESSGALTSALYAHPPTGIVGTDAPMLREFIGDLPDGGLGYLPNGGDTPYALDAGPNNIGLEITKNCTLRGVCDVYPVRAAIDAIDQPTGAPWLRGAVLLQTAAGADIIGSTDSVRTINLHKIGARFDEDIAFLDTGHAFMFAPSEVDGTGRNHGLVDSRIEDCMAWGGDGDHNHFWLMNFIYCRFHNLRWWGGGGVLLEGLSDAAGYNYGNSDVGNLYGMLFVGGSRHGIAVKQNRANAMGLINFNGRIQVNGALTSAHAPGAAEGTIAQHLFKADEGGFAAQYSFAAQKDFEVAPTAPAYPVAYGANTRTYIQPGGISGKSTDLASRSHRVWSDVDSGSYMDHTGVRRGSLAPAPTIAAGAAIGSTGTATISGDDTRGVVTLVANGTGITNAYNNQAAVITPGTAGGVRHLQLRPVNAAASLVGDLVAYVSGSTFLLRWQGNGTGALVAGASGQWAYQAIMPL